MQCRKEEVGGKLYLAYQYSYGVIRRQNPRERAERRKVTSEAKRKINALNRRFELMKLVSVNFTPGRDLFVELGWDHEPDEKEDAQALKSFHRRMRRAFQKAGREYKYILVTETHKRDGSDTRLHHHVIMTGLTGRDLALVAEAWPYGSVDVRSLRELTDNFEDTCKYLLKEKKPKNKRAYNTSSNLKRPPEPLKRRVAESADLIVPPGVKLVNRDRRDTDCGRYQILVGKIIDQKAFNCYWDKAQHDRRRVMEQEHWAKYARQKKRGAGRPYLARNGV